MKRKNLLSIALVLLLVAITTLTFAYWDELTGSKGGTIEVGQGKRVTITETASVPADKKLIPAGAVQGTNDVYSITVTYKVELTELVDGYHLDVNVDTGHDLILENTTIGAFTDKVAVVTVVFTLGEPTSAAEYLEVANNPFVYTVTFDYNNIA